MSTSLQGLSTHIAYMELSVVIPVRNGGESLRCCLEALRASTRLPDEIIVSRIHLLR
jgi:hypothetical protein